MLGGKEFLVGRVVKTKTQKFVGGDPKLCLLP
jgi:hypothetical protein